MKLYENFLRIGRIRSVPDLSSGSLKNSIIERRFRSYKHIKVIMSNLAGLFAIMAILLAVMTVTCFILEEPAAAPGFAISFLISGVIYVILKFLFPKSEELELRHAMIFAALAYFIVPAVSAIPFISIEHMTILDAFFEAISGWTGSGFTMILYPEHSTHAIQLWRSVIQWIGGIGVIVLMVSILIRPGTSTYILYQSEARKERIQPSIRSTIKTIWALYLVLTFLGIILLMMVGMPLWDSINHCMVAISTGGFSIYSDSIAHYNSVPVEFVLMIIMVLGALPFVFIFRLIKSPKSMFNEDMQVKAFLLIILVGVAALTLELFIGTGHLFESLRLAAFQFVSAITCTGLQTSMMADWSSTALLILSLAMIIGGCAGSTAGGIKIARAIFLNNAVDVWIKRMLYPRNAIITIKMGNKRIGEDVFSKELSEATLISFLWLVTLLASVMVLSHYVPPGFDIGKVFFTVCSAQGNVGLSVGIVDSSLHYIGKIMLMINMWIGRLEIVPVTLLIRYLIKGFKI